MLMNAFIYSGLFSFIANIAVGLYVYTRTPHKKANQLFALFSLTVGGWSVGSFLVNIIPDQELALRVLRFNYLFAVWTPTLYLHFIYALAEIRKSEIKTRLQSAYIGSSILSPFVFTTLFIPHLSVIGAAGFRISSPGIVYYFFFVFFAVVMIEILIQSFRQIKQKYGLHLMQFKYVAIANFFAIAAGFEYFSRVFGLFSLPPFDDYLLIAYTLILAAGITQYRLLDDEAMIKALKKERLSTLGILAASISHEIKNPLMIARNALDNYFRPQKTSASDPNAYLQNVHQQIQRICQIMDGFNRIFRKEDLDKCFQIKSANIEKNLDSAAQMVRLLYPNEQVQIKKNFPNNLSDVFISSIELEEVFLNLMINAFDAIENEGIVRCCVVELNDRIKIELSDTGEGIAANKIKNLFEPFNSIKGYQGTGLGLYITKQIVERYGGTIKIISHEGKGTAFLLELLKSVNS